MSKVKDDVIGSTLNYVKYIWLRNASSECSCQKPINDPTKRSSVERVVCVGPSTYLHSIHHSQRINGWEPPLNLMPSERT